jgi:uncharacterized SAM-binding protein YcdF (DUF218 family)
MSPLELDFLELLLYFFFGTFIMAVGMMLVFSVINYGVILCFLICERVQKMLRKRRNQNLSLADLEIHL